MYKYILNAKLNLESEVKKQSCLGEVHLGGESPHLRRSLHVSLNSTMAGNKISV